MDTVRFQPPLLVISYGGLKSPFCINNIFCKVSIFTDVYALIFILFLILIVGNTTRIALREN
jgi:hypothetical protein